jgi:hypothetical protein
MSRARWSVSGDRASDSTWGVDPLVWLQTDASRLFGVLLLGVQLIDNHLLEVHF